MRYSAEATSKEMLEATCDNLSLLLEDRQKCKIKLIKLYYYKDQIVMFDLNKRVTSKTSYKRTEIFQTWSLAVRLSFDDELCC